MQPGFSPRGAGKRLERTHASTAAASAATPTSAATAASHHEPRRLRCPSTLSAPARSSRASSRTSRTLPGPFPQVLVKEHARLYLPSVFRTLPDEARQTLPRPFLDTP